MTVAANLLLLLALPAGAAAADFDSAAQPIYRLAESFTDGVYNLVDKPLSFVLPDRLATQLDEAPPSTSYELFRDELLIKQGRTQPLIAQSLPAGASSSDASAAWRVSAVAGESRVLSDALSTTLAARYGLNRLAAASRDYAGDSANWDAGHVASAALFSGAYAYFVGVRADLAFGPAQLDIDVKSGDSLRRGGAGRYAALRLSERNSPFSLETHWGMHDGRVEREGVGFNYSRRF